MKTQQTKLDMLCECGLCTEDNLYFECLGCKSQAPYCLGQDDNLPDHCTSCWWQLDQNLVTVVAHSDPHL